MNENWTAHTGHKCPTTPRTLVEVSDTPDAVATLVGFAGAFSWDAPVGEGGIYAYRVIGEASPRAAIFPGQVA